VHTLAIIDLQRDFFYSLKDDSIFERAKNQIDLAMKADCGIIVCEEKGRGPTLNDFLAPLKNYKRLLKFEHYEAIPAEEIFTIAKQQNFSTINFVLCGLNPLATAKKLSYITNFQINVSCV